MLKRGLWPVWCVSAICLLTMSVIARAEEPLALEEEIIETEGAKTILQETGGLDADGAGWALVDLPPQQVFAPPAIDDDVRVVLDGEFPDLCHHLGPTLVDVDRVQKKIYIQQKARYYPGSWSCVEEPKHFSKLIDLSKLGIDAPGNYSIFLGKPGTPCGKPAAVLSVAPKSTVVEPLAPVSKVTIDSVKAPITSGLVSASPMREYYLVFRGKLSTPCQRFKAVEVMVRKGRVIDARLVLAPQDPGEICAQSMQDFHYSMRLGPMKSGKYLLHVRSAAGSKPLDRLVEF